MLGKKTIDFESNLKISNFPSYVQILIAWVLFLYRGSIFFLSNQKGRESTLLVGLTRWNEGDSTMNWMSAL